MIEMNKKRFNRESFVRLLKDNDWVLSLYNWYYLIRNNKKYIKEVDHRSKLSIFDYRELSQEIPFCPIERIKDSNFYGQAKSFKEYSDTKSFNYAIEHGLYYDDYIPIASYLSTVKKILTFSDVRESVLKSQINKEVIKVGPYIHYALSFLEEEGKRAIKKEYGKILLFFPTHSCANEGETYNVKNTINIVSDLANRHEFDNVFVNMYYYDVLHSSYAEEYEKAGFKIVTAGHRLDPNFLSRLRSIIELSDYTISNNVGTQLGYCIYLGKPHCIFDKTIVEASKYEQLKEIGRCFYNFESSIQPYQLEVVNKYWGVNNLKTKEELHDILIKQ